MLMLLILVMHLIFAIGIVIMLVFVVHFQVSCHRSIRIGHRCFGLLGGALLGSFNPR